MDHHAMGVHRYCRTLTIASLSQTCSIQANPKFFSSHREHAAEEVYVTGTFDDWTKSVKLDKIGDVFQKTVELPDASRKIYYKFVVNNDWVVNESAPKEPDHEGNINNFLTPEQIVPAASASTINTVTPNSTTAAMAAVQPVESKVLDEKVAEKPLETPAETKPVEESFNEKASEADLPKETPSDIPGGFPATPATELDKPISINPLPASEGLVNPITLQPGEKIPESITTQSTDKYVKLDKESYEKSDALPGFETEQLPPVSSNTIPESSLPILGDNIATLSSVAPTSTTAALAAEVPLETKAPTEVPEVVKESQEQAQVSPEASAVPAEVREKAKLEEELKETVPPAVVTSDDNVVAQKEAEKAEGVTEGGLAAIAATAGGAIIAAGLVAKETIGEQAAPYVAKAVEAIPDSVKEQLPAPAQDALVTEAKEVKEEEVSSEVPPEVKESIVEAGKSPEAAANTDAVEDKKAVESELLKEVTPVPAVTDTKAEEVAPAVPAEVKESIVEAGKSPEAASNTEAVEDKKAVESELLKEVKPVPAVTDTKPKETLAPALQTETPKTEEVKPEEPKSVAPVTSTENGTAPIETAPTESAATETAPTETTATENGSKAGENGSKADDANGTSKDHKKKHRISAFFQKIKSKLN
ncbi:hypothetical protein B0T10DRAFT_468263 [Thelonectria olida]|uniref:AMP-activated protein kinase glycogen-binding domain-containing protein n=1 Tax=Thelonectria olida TaxID=1576542 RepID=A0A9P8WKV4_9HYPO|nr:hypothetical protein B0T10DRAFT_468263 [Thelonectria olida]